MKTALLWLLVSFNASNYGPVTPVERFATVQECERVKDVLAKTAIHARFICVQAVVALP